MLLHASEILELRVSFWKSFSLLSFLLTTDQNCSIGFNSGEYGRHINTTVASVNNVPSYVFMLMNRNIVHDNIEIFRLFVVIFRAHLRYEYNLKIKKIEEQKTTIKYIIRLTDCKNELNYNEDNPSE